MHVKKLTGYLFAFFVVLGGNSLAVSPAEGATAQQRIDQYTREAEAITQKRELLKKQLVDLQIAMEAAQQKDIPEKAAWEAAQQDFDKYSELYEQDPSPQNEGRLHNAEFKLHLAERKLRKANGELESLENEYGEIKGQLTQLRQELASLNSKIEEQRRVQEVTRAKRKEEALKKAEAERLAAKREVERLKAMLAAKEQGENSPATGKKEAATSDNKVLVASTSKQPIATGADQSGPLELDDNFFLLTNAEQVSQEKQRLEDRLGGRAARLRTNKILNIQHFVNGSEQSKNSHRFKGLGNYQYRAEAQLSPGENRIRVSFDRWTVNVPAELANREYVFLMDSSGRDEPRMVCYPVSLD